MQMFLTVTVTYCPGLPRMEKDLEMWDFSAWKLGKFWANRNTLVTLLVTSSSWKRWSGFLGFFHIMASKSLLLDFQECPESYLHSHPARKGKDHERCHGSHFRKCHTYRLLSSHWQDSVMRQYLTARATRRWRLSVFPERSYLAINW